MAELTDRQQAFVDHYVVCLNGAEAARRAGYAASGARQEAHRLLTNADIRGAIDARLAESAMAAGEVLGRLTEHARSTMTDFLSVKGRGVALDLKKAAMADRLHLVKKYSKTKQGVSIELYDAQAALALMAKHHGLLVERHEHTWKDELKQQGHDPDAIKQQLITAAIAALSSADRRDDAGGDSSSAPVDSTG